MPDTGLAKLVADGKYTPYDTESAADTISEFYRYIPEYVRVMRIQRDIPTGLIGCGVKNSNLRQLVENQMREKKIIPNEIRLREVGLNKADETFDRSEFKLKTNKYVASGGKEFFISFVNKKNMLSGFIRLRIPYEPFRKEIAHDSQTALIRELHVYGSEVEIGNEGKGKVQHSGFGSQLLAEAERLAIEEFDSKKMIVISGIGVREYYKKHGYRLDGAYMGKPLV
jgi:elongator complex protein 3